MDSVKYKKKLIEVAMPLEVINEASVREKSIKKGHPSTMHLYWARRPLAACRAVIFAQLVDDPSSHPEKFPTQEEQNIERKRLFKMIEELVLWENFTNEELIKKANAEILKSCDGELPAIYDPFSGGGSIPLEAQRLGLPSYGSDLNPVAVIIGKAMIEIPPLFKDTKPINPSGSERLDYKNAEGLAEDVKFYGDWMIKEAFKLLGHLYPKVDLPKEYGGEKANVIAWVWTRTVPSPDPAFQGIQVPITSNFLLSAKKGKEAFIVPIVNKQEKTINYKIVQGGNSEQWETAKHGTKLQRGANFICLLSGAAIRPNYVKECGGNRKIGSTLLAIVAETKNGKVYLPGNNLHIEKAFEAVPQWKPDTVLSKHPQYIGVLGYGMTKIHQLFTNRQLLALTTCIDLVKDVRKLVEERALEAGMSSDETPLRDLGKGAKAYGEAVSVYLSFVISKVSNLNSSLTRWRSDTAGLGETFGRQAIPMVWDYAEANIFSNSAGNLLNPIKRISETLTNFPVAKVVSKLNWHDAQTINYPDNTVISTDPPYYDNIGYADLSDYFYAWMKPALASVYPNLFSLMATPKSEELVADRVRHEGKSNAEKFFLEGMTKTIKNMADKTSNFAPITIFYAFKQSEIIKDGIISTGWATFLEAVINSGYSIVGTWPMRTEMTTRMRAIGSNALSNSIVLVCRKSETSKKSITRREFIKELKSYLPQAISNLKQANITPADLPQASIGPGIAVFSKYKLILENDDTPMSVKTALKIINKELSEDQEDYDAETAFAITWFEQFGFNTSDFGTANKIANAIDTSVETLIFAGIAKSSAGKFSLLNRNELEEDWNPITDKRLTIWECCQYLIKCLENKGELETAKLIKFIGFAKADLTKQLAYTLYNIASNKLKDSSEAMVYNSLISIWSDLTTQANTFTENDLKGNNQLSML